MTTTTPIVEDPSSSSTIINHAASLSVAGRPLPPVPVNNDDDSTTQHGSIVLFYQYKEHPVWTRSEHKHVLKHMTRLGEQYGITGRGRIAPEGVNCTLTSRSPAALRAFVQALREWNPSVFQTTDFKITDGLAPHQVFGSLSLRKTTELVAYGLSSSTADPTTDTTSTTTAPSITHFGGHHLPADAYHQALAQEDTVVIDVRNRYETQLGRLAPPPGGATLLDPQLRHSNEFPAWLDRIQPQLENKTVLMYCTGGIRCERATALLNQMRAAAAAAASSSSSSSSTAAAAPQPPKAVYELQGGIERYLHTFPQGGYWKGKNYLFDRRFEQVPAQKSLAAVEAEMDQATCCVCTRKWTVYRGQYACDTCRVPVIVCTACASKVQQQQQQQNSSTCTKKKKKKKIRLECDLCRQGYRAPTHTVDLVGMKRQAEAAVLAQGKKRKQTQAEDTPAPADDDVPCNRLFLSRLPLIVSKTKIADALECHIELLHWITDPSTGSFYGSCMVQTNRKVQLCKRRCIVDHKRPFRVRPVRDTVPWPPPVCVDTELPPLGFVTSSSSSSVLASSAK